MKQANESRRRFVKKALYIPPAIATLTVLPAFAQSGSGQPENGPQVEQDNLQVSQNTVASPSAARAWVTARTAVTAIIQARKSLYVLRACYRNCAM